ncbi:hypothetical protein CBL_13184 [Carabus blaptoides fortunei]
MIQSGNAKKEEGREDKQRKLYRGETETIKHRESTENETENSEKEIRDNGKAEEAIQLEIDSEPVIESSQDRELSFCQSTVDVVVTGPKATNPFKVINKSGEKVQSGRNLFPQCADSESLVLVEEFEIAETDSRNLEKQNNSSVKDQMALDCDINHSSVLVVEESDSNDTQYMSHLHIEPDSINVALDTTNCEETSAACACKDTVRQVNPNDTTVSINLQFIAELDAAARNNSVVEIPDDITCRKLVFNTNASMKV